MPPRILAVLDTYPALSETFLYTALENLQAAGFEISIRARRKGYASHGRSRVASSLRGRSSRRSNPIANARNDESTGLPALKCDLFNVRYLPSESLPFLLKAIFVCWYALRLLLTAPKKFLHAARLMKTQVPDLRQRALIAFRILPLLCENVDAIYLPFGGLAVKYLELIQIHSRVFFSLRGSDINIEPLLSETYATRLKDAMRAARRVHCVCEDIKRKAAAMSGVDAQKFDVIYTALNPLFLESAPIRDSSAGRVRIVTTGRLDWRKGLEHGLMAIRALARRGIPCEWNILGEGPHRLALEWGIRDMGLGETVCLRGGKSQEDVREILSQSDIFFLPSVHEGISNAALEAMAWGLPVVVGDVGGMSEAISNEETGILVPPRDWKGMADALERLAKDENLRRQMGARARELVRQRFTLEKQRSGFVEFFGGIQ